MPDPRNVYFLGTGLLAWFVLLLCVGNAAAYVGPGAGLEFIGYALSLLGLGVAAFSAMLLWPVYAFFRWLRNGKQGPVSSSTVEPLPEGAHAFHHTDP